MVTLTDHNFTRISSTHYQYISVSPGRIGKKYDLIYHEDLRRWLCNCGDSVYNKNTLCKHRRELRLLIEILEQQDSANKDASDVVERLERVECEAALVEDRAWQKIKSLEEELQAERKTHVEVCCQLDRSLGAEMEKRMALQEQLEHMQHAIATVEAINAQLVREMEALHEQIKSIQPITISTPSVVIDAAKATRAARSKDRQDTEPQIEEEWKNDRLVACMIDGYKVSVNHVMAMACNCGLEQQCKHMNKIDGYIAKKAFRCNCQFCAKKGR